MATLTANQAVSGVQPKGHHVGVLPVSVTYSLPALSAGDRVLLCKVPHGARIDNIQRNAAAGAGNDVVLNFGYTYRDSAGNEVSSLSAFGSATAAAGVGMLTKGLPYTVSLSDEVVKDRFAYIVATAATVTSASATGSLSLVVHFTNDTV